MSTSIRANRCTYIYMCTCVYKNTSPVPGHQWQTVPLHWRSQPWKASESPEMERKTSGTKKREMLSQISQHSFHCLPVLFSKMLCAFGDVYRRCWSAVLVVNWSIEVVAFGIRFMVMLQLPSESFWEVFLCSPIDPCRTATIESLI